MPTFEYHGQSSAGRQSGTIEAGTKGAVAEILRGRGIQPIEIIQKSEAFDIRKAADRAGAAGKGLELGSLLPKKKKAPKREEIMMVARQMQVMLRAGVPILSGLSSLRDAASSPELREVIADVIHQLESGLDLSTSLAKHPQAFDDFFISMVRVGEETGKLDEVFWALYERMEFDDRINKQIKTATRYPMFVMIAIAVAIAIVNLMVIPAFAKVFANQGAELPLLTRVLLGTSRFAQDQLPLIVVALVAAHMGFKAWIKTPPGKLSWHGFLLKMPLFGTIILKASLARFCRGMALALSSGVPVISAISIVAKTTDNESLGVRLLGMRSSIERGESVLNAASQTGVFPPMVIQMVAVGDQSGQLDDMMTEVSSSYTKEVQYEIQTLSQRIEPILIGVMGVLVLILALGIFLPIWDLGRVTLGKG
jgi:MSHA biogenesis protein MshG